METPPPSTHKSAASSPNSCCSFELNRFTGRDFTAFEIEKHEAQRELQQMVNRYNDAFQLLKGAVSAVEILRDENLCLTVENLQLEAAVAEKEKGKSSVIEIKNGSDFDSPSGSGSGSEVLTGSGSGSGSGSASDKAKPKSAPTPKSIAIRSREYLANTQTTPGGAHRLRLPVPPALQEGENEAGEVEVDVYNQGTEKTELCNKWGEIGSCPYKDRCRFAHGMEEMKPVIRHPRYKTQLCRMMGSGGSCPYGHRCHFRHALGTPKP